MILFRTASIFAGEYAKSLATLNVNPGKESRTEESQDEQKQAPDG
jgi:hypothetical protein